MANGDSYMDQAQMLSLHLIDSMLRGHLNRTVSADRWEGLSLLQG